MNFFGGRILYILFTVGLAIAIYMLATMNRLRRSNPDSLAADQFDRDKDYILYGALLIDGGQEYFPDWQAAMIREYDSSLKPLLPQLYEASQAVARLPDPQRPEAARQHVIKR